jgi:hypothetical protein
MGGDIIFSGCSFTWGQGLWSYCPSDLKMPTVNEYIEQGYGVPDVGEFFRQDNRYASLVAKHFYSREIIKRWNGGTDDESIKFIEDVRKNWVTRHSLLTENVIWDNVKYIVFQTTQPYRSPFTFYHKNKEYQVISEPGMHNLERVQEIIRWSDEDCPECDNAIKETIEHPNLDIFLDWLIDNNLSVDDFAEIHLKHMSGRIKESLKHYEETYGIKTLIISWTDEYLPYFIKDKFCNERLVRLKYNSKEFNCIAHLFQENKKFEILNDDETLHETGTDGHPSLKCHRVIADSLIEKITYRNKNGFHNVKTI